MENSLSSRNGSLFPIPSALLTMRSPCGAVKIFPAAWMGMVCSRPAVLSLAFRSGKYGWQEGGGFAVNLPAGNLLNSSPFLGWLAGEDSDVLTFPGLSLEAGKMTDAPLISECPVRIECNHAVFSHRYDRYLVHGEVAAVHMDDITFGAEGMPTDIGRLHPFADAWRRNLLRLSQAAESLPASRENHLFFDGFRT